MSGLELLFYAGVAILLMREAGRGDRPGIGTWIVHRLYNIRQLRPWPRTGAHFSWQYGSSLPWAADMVKHDIKDGETRADAIMEAHLAAQGEDLRR